MPKPAPVKTASIPFLTIQIFGMALAFPLASARSEDFHGLVCYDGCPKVKAGYNWAREHDNRDSGACQGQGTDFEKGCSMYVYEAGPAPPPPKKDDPDRTDADDARSSGRSLDSSR